jgi:hypothetical protein
MPARSRLIAACVALTTSAIANADCSETARESKQRNEAAATTWIDADWGRRNDAAARALTRCHAAFAAQGYALVDVEVYVENGDLQGFFVSYTRTPR